MKLYALAFALLLLTGRAYAQDVPPILVTDDPRVVPFSTVLGLSDGNPSYVMQGNVLFGRPDAWPYAPDCFMPIASGADGSPKLHCRALVLADIGDSSDLALRRAGPDNVPYNTTSPEDLAGGVNIGTIYWQAWGGTNVGGHGWSPTGTPTGGGTCCGRIANIYARTVGAQTATSRAGMMCLGTTSSGSTNPTDRVCIGADGTVSINFGGTMKQVTQSGSNSCGTGYRCLRVPN